MDEHYHYMSHDQFKPIKFSAELQGLIVSLWMNTIGSHDQFEPIRLRENLVVNCKHH